MTLYAIKGIFRALDALVVEGVTNEIWNDHTRGVLSTPLS
jgi:hypothetical protein